MITTNDLLGLYCKYTDEAFKYEELKNYSNNMHDNIQYLIANALCNAFYELYKISEENDGK
jgi:hypothetical protein